MRRTFVVVMLLLGAPALAHAQQAPGTPGPPPQRTGAADHPSSYTIGPDDVLSIVFWQEKDMSGEVTVRPDGHISLPLINDIQAAGLTPEQLRLDLEQAASRFLQAPTAAVVVKQINSRKVFITGMVSKPGPYPLTTPMTVLQLIALAGGLLEYAERENIVIVRSEQGQQISHRFNYKEVAQQKRLGQNLELRPGDTVLVP